MTRGELGETLAAGFLAARGYDIAARNFRTRYGELDLIARKDGFLVFVEVKLRAGTRFGEAREAVTAAKQRKLILAAQEWLSLYPDGLQPRFDVIEIYLRPGARVPENILHLENAFDAFDA